MHASFRRKKARFFCKRVHSSYPCLSASGTFLVAYQMEVFKKYVKQYLPELVDNSLVFPWSAIKHLSTRVGAAALQRSMDHHGPKELVKFLHSICLFMFIPCYSYVIVCWSSKIFETKLHGWVFLW